MFLHCSIILISHRGTYIQWFRFRMKKKKILFSSSSCMLGMYVCLPRYRQTRYGRNPAVWMKGPPKVKRISRTKKNPNGIIMHSTRPFTTSLYLSQHDQTYKEECSRKNWVQYLNHQTFVRIVLICKQNRTQSQKIKLI